MFWAKRESRTVGLLGVIVLAVAVPACNAPGGMQLPWVRRSYPDSTNVVQRPVFPLPQSRPLFVSGYAGASYGPPWAIPVAPPVAPAGEQPKISIDRGSWEPE
jgi:hypothetical protein